MTDQRRDMRDRSEGSRSLPPLRSLLIDGRVTWAHHTATKGMRNQPKDGDGRPAEWPSSVTSGSSFMSSVSPPPFSHEPKARKWQGEWRMKSERDGGVRDKGTAEPPSLALHPHPSPFRLLHSCRPFTPHSFRSRQAKGVTSVARSVEWRRERWDTGARSLCRSLGLSARVCRALSVHPPFTHVVDRRERP